MSEKIYLVTGDESITELGVLKETPRYIMVNLDQIRFVRGRLYHVAPRLRKGQADVFRNLRDAYQHCLKIQEIRIARMEEDLLRKRKVKSLIEAEMVDLPLEGH